MYQKAKYYVFYGIFLGSCLRLAALIRQRNTHIILISWLIRASGTSFMRFSRPLKVTQHRINHQTTRQHSIFLSFRSLPRQITWRLNLDFLEFTINKSEKL